MKSITVNSKVYHIEDMNVVDTMTLHLEVMTTFGSSIGAIISGVINKDKLSDKKLTDNLGMLFSSIDVDKCQKIINRVLAQVITPTNEYLRDPAVMQTWFSANKEDLWIVVYKAMVELVGEFLPISLIKDQKIAPNTDSQVMKK